MSRNDKTMGKEYSDPVKRKRYLEDNAEGVEKKGYMKAYSPEELQGHKEELANTMIQISEIEAELAFAKESFKARLKPLQEKRNQMLSNIKAKSEYVTEDCYKFVDREARITEYYNADGDLVEMRPSTADELQLNIFSINNEMRDGTND